MTGVLRAVLFCVFVSLFAPNANAANPAEAGKGDVVFQIGTFNRSSIEFSQSSPKQPVNFIVGESNPLKDWYATQSAALAAATGSKTLEVEKAPRTITFSIGSLKEAYKMHLSLLIESASVPAIQVNVNEKRRLFYLHPLLEYSNGDQTDSFYPAYSHADVEFTLHAGALHSGKNTITRFLDLGGSEPDGYCAVAFVRPEAGDTYRCS
ncbi:MAG: polysaccharide lyase family protein [Alloacidobacterium sp.]|jgi:hypothetical protein